MDELIKKHEAFEKTLEAQEEKITTLKQLADALLAQEHYASSEIETRCTGVIERRDRVKGCAVQRHTKLIDSLNYQQFLANIHEVGYDQGVGVLVLFYYPIPSPLVGHSIILTVRVYCIRMKCYIF